MSALLFTKLELLQLVVGLTMTSFLKGDLTAAHFQTSHRTCLGEKEP